MIAAAAELLRSASRFWQAGQCVGKGSNSLRSVSLPYTAARFSISGDNSAARQSSGRLLEWSPQAQHESTQPPWLVRTILRMRLAIDCLNKFWVGHVQDGWQKHSRDSWDIICKRIRDSSLPYEAAVPWKVSLQRLHQKCCTCLLLSKLYPCAAAAAAELPAFVKFPKNKGTKGGRGCDDLRPHRQWGMTMFRVGYNTKSHNFGQSGC